MEPILAIVWIAVAVFAVTSLIAVLYLAGLLPKVPKEHGKHLDKILIAEIVVFSVSAFGYYLKAQTQPKDMLTLPLSNFMLKEQDAIVAVRDDVQTLFIKATDVSRSRREADIKISDQENLAGSQSLKLKPDTLGSATISDQKYLFRYVLMGTLDADPREQQAKPKDFVLISIKRDTNSK